ncbi:MAG: TIGR03084 family metal-binding protein [Pseudomonadota bacterium]
MQEAQDFLDESRALLALIEPLSDEELAAPTAFKNWSVNRVIRHLHMWNHGAHLGLTDAEGFDAWFQGVAKGLASPGGMGAVELEFCPAEGRALVETWASFLEPMSGAFAEADPKHRVKWAGPSMSARSSISARLMETWAHGLEIYDLCGVDRVDTDRIRSVVVLGVNTYGWTFKVNGREAPEPRPYLSLTAPSGEIWTYGEESAEERIEGLASHFCQVVTQTRNIADVDLTVAGPNAVEWMRISQCFAGPPETPPAPGTRTKGARGG